MMTMMKNWAWFRISIILCQNWRKWMGCPV